MASPSRSIHVRSILSDLSATFVALPEGVGIMVKLTEGTSLRGTMFNLANTMLGAGILGLPHAAEQTGVVTAVIMLVVVALLQDLSAWMLLVGVDAAKEVSFGVVAEVLYSRSLGILVDSMVLLNNFGVLTAYIVILGDLLPSFMSFVGAPTVLTNRTLLICTCMLVILIPLSSLRKMGALRLASMGCLLAIALFVAVMVCMGSGWISVSHATDGAVPLFNSNALDVLGQLPMMLFAYNCNMNVPILYGELRRQGREAIDSRFRTKREKMMVSMHGSLTICCVFYCIAAVEGCMAFRDRTETNVLNNLKNGDFGAAPYFKVTYAGMLCFSFPVMCFSCVASLHRLLWHCRDIMPCKPESEPAWRPRQDSVVSRSGGSWQQGLVRTLSHQDQPLHNGEAGEEEAWPTDNAVAESAPPEAGCAVHQLEVVFVVGSVVALGLAFPNLGAVFGLTGGVCGSFLSYIFPGMLYFRATQGAMHRTLGAVIFTFGIVVTIVTTVLVL